jgi:hypothetical protein
LIRRHIRIKPHIHAKVDRFFADKLEGSYVIGIHYRATDKRYEVAPVPFEVMRAAIVRAMASIHADRLKLFLATDDQRFLDYLRSAFPDRLTYREIIRSLDDCPLDMMAGSNYDKGEEALIDCMLLSRCNQLVRTASNLSLIAAMMAPEMPETFVSIVGATR